MRYAFLQRLEAVQFLGFHEGGRSNPAILQCESIAGDRREVICKWPSIAEGQILLVHEVIAAQLAGDVGLPIVTPCIVDISPEFAAACRSEFGDRWRADTDQVAFGCDRCIEQVVEWGRGSRLSSDEVQTGAEIFFFDAVTANADRRYTNSNLLRAGGALRAIDHERCFSHRLLLAKPRPPWELDGMSHLVLPGDAKHALADALKGRPINFDDIRRKWTALPDDIAASYPAAIPPEWREQLSVAHWAMRWVEQVVENIDGCIGEARRVLEND